jgi:hypothetical protein
MLSKHSEYQSQRGCIPEFDINYSIYTMLELKYFSSYNPEYDISIVLLCLTV